MRSPKSGTMTEPIFIGARIYRGSSYGAHHPLSIPRVPTVTDLSRALGWLPDTQYRTSPCAKPSALTGFHTPDYIAALQRAEATQRPDPAHDLGTLSNPVFPEVYRRPATAAAGGLLAAEHVRAGGVAYNPGGGTHHGLPDRANGFCYLNEPVLTIRHLLGMGLRQIAYVDIDAHHCDGVAVAFHGSEQVRMISVHEDKRWPFTGALDDDAGGFRDQHSRPTRVQRYRIRPDPERRDPASRCYATTRRHLPAMWCGCRNRGSAVATCPVEPLPCADRDRLAQYGATFDCFRWRRLQPMECWARVGLRVGDPSRARDPKSLTNRSIRGSKWVAVVP